MTVGRHRKRLREWSLLDTLFGPKPGNEKTYRWPPDGTGLVRLVSGVIDRMEVHVIPRVRHHWYSLGVWTRAGGLNLVGG